MPRFNLTNIAVLLALAGVCAEPTPVQAQVSATETAAVRDHVNKGNYYMARNQFEQAISEYEAALDVDPGSMVAKENLVLVHNNWGILLFRQRKWEEAKAEWEQALKMNPYDRNAKQNLLVLKSTLARLGPPKPPPPPPEKPGDKKETATGDGKPEEQPTASGGVVIMNSGARGKVPAEAGSPREQAPEAKPEVPSSGAVVILSKPTESSGAAVILSKPAEPTPPPAPPPPEPPAAAPTQIMNSPYSFVEETRPARPGDSSPYVMPTSVAAPPKIIRPYVAPPKPATKPADDPWNTPVSIPSTQPTPPAPNTPAATESSDEPANLEDQVGAIEIKLNGRKQKGMPIFKRIEKLETAISGQTRTGTLQERIEALRKSCGL